MLLQANILIKQHSPVINVLFPHFTPQLIKVAFLVQVVHFIAPLYQDA